MIFFGSENNEKKPLEQGAVSSSAPVITVTFLTILSQILNIFSSQASVMPLINLISKTVFPIISTTIAYTLGGRKALVSGLLGGILTASGISFSTLNVNAHGVSGLYGCIIAGKIAGKSLRIIRTLNLLKHKADRRTSSTYTSVLATSLTLASALIVNETSLTINSLITSALTTLSSFAPLLVCVLSGILICTGSGPFYLSGYLFSAAALATGQGEILVSTMAALTVSGLSIGLFCLLYSDKFSKSERICAYTALCGGIFGVSSSTLPFYTAKPSKILISIVPGGCVTSLLCALFRCNTDIMFTGLKYLLTSERSVYFILSIICGVLVSVYILSLFFIEEPMQDETKNDSVVLSTKTAI